MFRQMRRWGLPALLALAGACTGPGAPGAAGPESAVQVMVENQYPSTVEVWAINGTNRARLGTVLPLETATFRVPRDVLLPAPFQFQLAAGPTGVSDAAYTSPEIRVSPGQEVKMVVDENLFSSTVTVQ